jgi:hypothetical protein
MGKPLAEQSVPKLKRGLGSVKMPKDLKTRIHSLGGKASHGGGRKKK